MNLMWSWNSLFIIVLLILLFHFSLGLKICYAIGIASTIGFFISGDTSGLQVIGRAAWKSVNSFDISAVPVFIFMGEIVVHCDLSKRFYRGASTWFSRLPGGFIQTSLFSCAVFAAISGSSVATAAAIGSVAFKELDDRGYSQELNLGSLAAGGALGLLIPPSTTFLIYGAITGTSVARLFLAGLIPGIITTIVFMLYITLRVVKNPSLAPPRPPKCSVRQKAHGMLDMVPFISLMVMILVSIYCGWATPTEAAAFSVMAAFIFSLIYRELTVSRIIDSAISTIRSTTMIFFIMISAQVFTSLLTLSGISRGLMKWFTESGFTSIQLFLGVCIIYLIVGCLMDGTSVLYLTLPLLFPLSQTQGWDPIWFGVIVCIMVCVGMITPPVGLNLFVIQGITEGRATFKQTCKGALPFVFAYLLMVIVVYFFPILATWLPSKMI